MNIKSPLVVPHLPLKDMDSAMLTLAINERLIEMSDPHVQVMTTNGVRLVNNALSLAAYLHRKDTRMSTTQASNGERNQPTTPYIVHPLRNTLRLIRWGVTDAQILAASLLHDVVEDHAREIVREFTNVQVSRRDHKKMREVALAYISSTFGADVAYLVNAVSNPILPFGMERDERNHHYQNHVHEAIQDPRVFLIKASDLNDNSLSLHHSFDPSDEGCSRRAKKYLPVMQMVLDALMKNYAAIEALTSPAGVIDIRERFEGAEAYLERFSAV